MKFEPEVLYEDDDIIAINKPAGLVVHSDGRTKEPSVSEWLVGFRTEAKGVGEHVDLDDEETIDRSGIVHRIDRETSGVLLLVKTEAGFQSLKKQFQNREIEKIYHLFVYGNLKDDFGTINLPITRSKADFRKRVAQPASAESSGAAKEALTYFKVLSRDEKGEATFVEAKPKTGRTHQIRVHFKAWHHPVVCDSLYTSKKPSLLGFNRLALHARSITFTNTLGEKVTIEAPYPQDFKQAMDRIGFGVLD